MHGQRPVRKISLNAGAIENPCPPSNPPPPPRDIFHADITDKFNFELKMDEFFNRAYHPKHPNIRATRTRGSYRSIFAYLKLIKFLRPIRFFLSLFLSRHWEFANFCKWLFFLFFFFLDFLRGFFWFVNRLSYLIVDSLWAGEVYFKVELLFVARANELFYLSSLKFYESICLKSWKVYNDDEMWRINRSMLNCFLFF